jgi:outer membrane protein OmpA-like peptidoglycan-associated protein
MVALEFPFRMSRLLIHRLLSAAAVVLVSGCSVLHGPLNDESDDVLTMQPHPRRAEMPSLLGPGSERIQSSRFPVIRFAAESWRISASEEPKIRTVARWLTGHPERVLLSAGARAATPEFARQLSDLRAQTVRRALVEAGAPASKILTVSFGEDAPEFTGSGVAFSLIGTGEAGQP